MPSHFRFGCFVIWTATLIFCLTNGVPIAENTVWDVFMSKFDSENCKLADYVILPNYNNDKSVKSNPETYYQTYDLTVPLKACMNSVKGSSLRTPLCNEVFDIIYNISTCSPEVQALYKVMPYLENKKPDFQVTNVTNVCEGFSAHRDLFLLDKEAMSYYLTDKNYCSGLCKADVAKACSFLLWGHQVQAFVHGVLIKAAALEKAAPESGNELDPVNTKYAESEKDQENAHKKEPEKNDPSEKVHVNSVDEKSRNHNVDSSTKAITQKVPNPDEKLKSANDPVEKKTEESKQLLMDPSKLPPNENSKTDGGDIPKIQLEDDDHKRNSPKSDSRPIHVDSKLSTKSITTPVVTSGSKVSSSASKSTKHSIGGEPGTTDNSGGDKALVITSGGTSKNVVTPEKADAEESEDKIMPGGSTEKQKGKKTEDISQSTNTAPVVTKADASFNELSKTGSVAAAVSEEKASANGNGDAVKEKTSSTSEKNPKTDGGKGADSDTSKASEKTSQPKADAELSSESEKNPPVIPMDNYESHDDVGQDDDGNGENHYDGDDSDILNQQEATENADSNIKNTVPEKNDHDQDQNAPSPVEESNAVRKIPSDSAGFPEQEDAHFFFYFITIVIFAIGGYVLFHNKQKIFALIIEGRHERRRRSGASYRKLETK